MTCMAAGRRMHVCGVSEHECVCVCACREFYRAGGIMDPLHLCVRYCRTLQSRAQLLGRKAGLACSWITSPGNSRYAISAAPIPLGYFQSLWPRHDWLDDVSVPANQEEHDPKPRCNFLLAAKHIIPAALNSSVIVQTLKRTQLLNDDVSKRCDFSIIYPIEKIFLIIKEHVKILVQLP